MWNVVKDISETFDIDFFFLRRWYLRHFPYIEKKNISVFKTLLISFSCFLCLLIPFLRISRDDPLTLIETRDFKKKDFTYHPSLQIDFNKSAVIFTHRRSRLVSMVWQPWSCKVLAVSFGVNLTHRDRIRLIKFIFESVFEKNDYCRTIRVFFFLHYIWYNHQISSIAEANRFISFYDNNYDSFFYFLKERFSLELVQNGIRVGYYSEGYGDWYSHSDTYFAFTKSQALIQPFLITGQIREMNNPKWLVPPHLMRKSFKFDYDVGFIQCVGGEEKWYEQREYLEVLEQVLVACYEGGSSFLFIEKPNCSFDPGYSLLADYKDRGLNLALSSDLYPSSYSALLHSKCLVSHRSTLGYEAHAAGMRVGWLGNVFSYDCKTLGVGIQMLQTESDLRAFLNGTVNE